MFKFKGSDEKPGVVELRRPPAAKSTSVPDGRSSQAARPDLGAGRRDLSPSTGGRPVTQAAVSRSDQQQVVKEPLYINYAGLRVSSKILTSTDEFSRIPFVEVLNARIGLGSHMAHRLVVVLISKTAQEVLIFFDRDKVSHDEIKEVVNQIENSGFSVSSEIQAFQARTHLLMALAQGHLDPASMKVARDQAKDPHKNSLFQTFTGVIAWAFDNGVDDVDWVVDTQSEKSQVAFKVGGRYIRPEAFLMPTDTMIQILGIAWQRSTGGSNAQFELRIEQQAQVLLELTPNSHRESARIRLRWSGMSNDRGTVVTMRLQRLGQSALISNLEGAGYLDYHMNTFRRVINSEGGLTCFSGVVGSGKSTSLAKLISMLPDHLKIQSIEDPVELEIPRAYQKTVTRDLTASGPEEGFLSASRAVYRSALDVLYLGEVRDTETGGVARQVVESGHSVYTTTHARSALGIIDRFVSPQIGIPREVLGAPDILKLLVYQALLPKVCPHCAKSPSEFSKHFSLKGKSLDEHHRYFDVVEQLYGIDRASYRMRDPHGCESCRRKGLEDLYGLSGRTVVCEMVEPDEFMTELISEGNSLKLQQYWKSMSDGQTDSSNMLGKTALECAVHKAAAGLIDPREVESRFSAFDTILQKRNASRAADAARRSTTLSAA